VKVVALDPVALLEANPDPERVMLMEKVREIGIGGDEGEES
jgi:hypothetical protein